MAFGLQAERDDYINTVDCIGMEAQDIEGMSAEDRQSIKDAAEALAEAMRLIPDAAEDR